jgi:predicted O-methyltransferase YrrM
MDYRVRRYATFGARLLDEAWVRPHWAACHLFGMIDQQILRHFHRGKVRQWNRDCFHHTRVIELLCQEVGREISEVRGEYESAKREWADGLTSRAIPPGRDASEELQFLLFSLVKLIRPQCVLEVGVARGASSRALLSALERTGGGRLVSIDFPFLMPDYAEDIGMLIPASLRKKWTLYIGPSQLLLPKVLSSEAAFQLIVHDGAHSYYIQRSDLRRSMGALERGGALVCDDLNNDSFLEVSQGQFQNVWCLKQPKKDEAIGLGWRRQMVLK